MQEKVTDNHKEMISHQNKLKPNLEGMDLVTGKNKWLKCLDRLKYDVEQDVIVTMDFNPPKVYHHLQVTVISDEHGDS